MPRAVTHTIHRAPPGGRRYYSHLQVEPLRHRDIPFASRQWADSKTPLSPQPRALMALNTDKKEGQTFGIPLGKSRCREQSSASHLHTPQRSVRFRASPTPGSPPRHTSALMDSLPRRLMALNLLCHFILPAASDHQPGEGGFSRFPSNSSSQISPNPKAQGSSNLHGSLRLRDAPRQVVVSSCPL